MSIKSWFHRGGTVIKPLIVGLALLPLLLPTKAHAWVRGGWGWHGGVFVGVAPPPVVVGPPVVYAPPPVVYAPPVAYAPPPPRGRDALSLDPRPLRLERHLDSRTLGMRSAWSCLAA